MDDVERLAQILAEMGEDVTQRGPGWLALRSSTLDVVLDVEDPFVLAVARLEVPPTPFDVLLGWVNSISSVLVAPQPHVQTHLGSAVVHYGVEQLRQRWPDHLLAERLADFLRDTRRHAAVVHAVASRPADPQPHAWTGDDGVVRIVLRCPRDHCAPVAAGAVALERRPGGAAEAGFTCATCGQARRLHLPQATADRLRRLGVHDPLTDTVIDDFIARVAAVEDLVSVLAAPEDLPGTL